MYERYLYQFENKKASSQQLLFAQNIELSLSDAQLLQGLIPELNNLGIDIREFGHQSFVIQGLPAEFNDQDGQAVVLQLLEQFKQNLDLKLEQFDNLSRSLAYQSAIKPGKFLMLDEMQLLIDELFACQIPYAGPNGRKTFISLDLEELDKRFE
jgi:DNA mismatch repair protein MutL